MHFWQLHTNPVPGECSAARRPVASATAILIILAASACLRAQNDAGTVADEKLLIVPLSGALDKKSVAGSISEVSAWIERKPSINWIVFEIDSPGGSYEAAIELGNYIFGELRGKTTVAFIPDEAQATDAAVIPVLACQEIAMGSAARLGAGKGDGAPTEEVLESSRQAVIRYSTKRKRSQLLASLMIMPAQEAVHSLRRKALGPEDRPSYVFWDQTELQNPDRIVERKSDYHDSEKILDRGKLLTLDQKRAYEYGWVHYRGIEGGDERYKSLLLKMKLDLPEESVFVVGRGAMKKHFLSGQGLIEFLNHPLVRFFLVLGIILGITIELKMLGTMVPGLIGIACFTLLVVGGLYPAGGGVSEPTTTWFEVVLFLVGIGLIGIEIGLVPGIAIFAVAGSLLCFGSMVMVMVPSTTLPGGEHLSYQEAFMLISTGLGASFALFFVILRFLPAGVSGGFVTSSAITGVPDADTAEESLRGNAHLLGKTGLCESPLRPAGIISLEDGEQIDVVADGEFIEKGEQVVIRECTSTRIVVSRAESDG